MDVLYILLPVSVALAFLIALVFFSPFEQGSTMIWKAPPTGCWTMTMARRQA